ncbi:hypothetical protein ACFLSA_05725 [Bacteroidota bacterium]
MMSKKEIILILTVLLQCTVIFAQDELKKEVEVTKAYEPVVKESNKINELPEITDTVSYVPDLKFDIQTRPVQTSFETEPLKAATMVGEPLTKLYNKYVNLGFGGFLTSRADIGISTLRSKEYLAGGYYNHYSTFGKIKLVDGTKTDAPFSDNSMTIFGTKFLENSILSGEFDLFTKRRQFYGYNPASSDILGSVESRRIRYNAMDLAIDYKSNYNDSLHLNYDVRFNYYFFTDDDRNYENLIHIQGQFDKFFRTEMAGLDFDSKYYDRSQKLDDENHFIIKIAPWIGKFGVRWQVKAGFQVVSYNSSNQSGSYIYPKASLQYNIVENIVVPYAGVDGNLQVNSLRSSRGENPFLNRSVIISNTDNKLLLFSGIRGNLSSKTSFNIRYTYQVTDSMYFFVNEGSLGNSFNVLYDDEIINHFFGEFDTELFERFTFGIKGNYFDYNLEKLQFAWHRPDFDLRISAGYNFMNKVIMNTEFFAIGQRKVTSSNSPGLYNVLDGAVDVNFRLQYNYTKILNFYLHLYNITSNQYSLWQFYPVQPFNVLVGVRYSFN